MTSARIIGTGRAGTSLHDALARAGVRVDLVPGRGDHIGAAGSGVDIVLLAVPDAVVRSVAAAVEPCAETVVSHVSGSLGLGPLAGHPRSAVLHPLVALPDPERGAAALVGAWFGISDQGDPAVLELVEALGGRSVVVREGDWPRYHAAAVVASNHLVALMGQVERIAASIDAPLDAYLDLARGALADVAALGPAAALTGPVRRGDTDTLRRHLEALPPEERAGYQTMSDEARRLC